MKSLAKKLVVAILSNQVKRLRRKNKFKIIAVAGSIGKTSTKFAIANVLSQKYRVRFQEGNYNDIVSVPLVFFGLEMPSLLNPIAWLKVFLSIEKQLKLPYAFDYVVLELGTDGPGQISKFSKYLNADLGILTAISPEHMEYFKTLEQVASEELAVEALCDQLLINIDLVELKYLDDLKRSYLSYSLRSKANYQLTNLKYHADGYEFELLKDSKLLFQTKHEAIAETQLYSLCATSAVADMLGLTSTEIENALHDIKAVDGRMQKLLGINNSLILDDTYNASPVATKAALDTIYKMSSPQKIAILGNMNELGQYSAAAHTEIGEYCDPSHLQLVVTIGIDANKFLAAAAQKRGCQVKTFTSPYEAGEFLKSQIKDGAVILAKGSQNGVFAEETIKYLLANEQDKAKLVRQSSGWLAKKKKAFSQ